LNLVYLVPGETGGMETYARELIPALKAERGDLRITAFVNREAYTEIHGTDGFVECVEVPVFARRRAEWVRGEQQLLPRLAARLGVDLLHSLASTAPIWGGFRRVVTIQDVIYRVYPEAHGGLRARGMRVLVPLAARRSDRVIVPSESTKNDVTGFLRVPKTKIDVIPLGVGAAPVAGTSEEELRRRLGLGSRAVVLTASAKRPHKNLSRLLDAWALLPSEGRPVLVLPGYATPHEELLRAEAARLGLESDIRFLGWIPSADIEGLYCLASCFVFPSLYEGFGLPVLEAMARGLPVVCSDRAALKEVAGDAARIVDPDSAHAIADAVQEVLGNPGLAEHLRTAGAEQAAKFTWSATARETLRTYELALGTTR
jgi:glycosyltransferase involved in cell wall biosynthesis